MSTLELLTQSISSTSEFTDIIIPPTFGEYIHEVLYGHTPQEWAASYSNAPELSNDVSSQPVLNDTSSSVANPQEPAAT